MAPKSLSPGVHALCTPSLSVGRACEYDGRHSHNLVHYKAKLMGFSQM